MHPPRSQPLSRLGRAAVPRCSHHPRSFVCHVTLTQDYNTPGDPLSFSLVDPADPWTVAYTVVLLLFRSVLPTLLPPPASAHPAFVQDVYQNSVPEGLCWRLFVCAAGSLFSPSLSVVPFPLRQRRASFCFRRKSPARSVSSQRCCVLVCPSVYVRSGFVLSRFAQRRIVRPLSHSKNVKLSQSVRPDTLPQRSQHPSTCHRLHVDCTRLQHSIRYGQR